MAGPERDIAKELQEQAEQIRLYAKAVEDGMVADKEKIELYKKQVEELEKQRKLEIERGHINGEQIKDTEKILQQNKGYLKNLQNINTATGKIYHNIAAAGNTFKDFLTDSRLQLELAEDMAEKYKALGVSIGMTGKGAKFMEKSFKGSLPAITEMGMGIDELSTIYQQMSESSGRMSDLTAEDAIRIGSIAESMDMSANEASEMTDSFRLMGLSTEKIEENILETYKSAQSMGLNATKVIKELQKNLKTMSTYSFANGVKGMQEMAKMAVKMRMDMGQILGLADKLYQPDAAIEAAAELQLLGGDIAEAFGDPFTLMYEARNKPEELAKRISKMTENMLQFNEETGEYELPAEARMQFQALEKATGLGAENMIEMTRQASKIKDIKMKFTSVGDDEMKESLASIAKFKDGKFVIETEEFGDLGLDQITDDMAETIMKEQQTSEESLRDIATHTKTMSDQMKFMREGAEYKVAGLTNIYELTADEVAPVMQSMKDGITKLADEYISKGETFIKDMFQDASGEKSAIDVAMEEMDNLSNKIKDGVITKFGELEKSSQKLNETFAALGGQSKKGDSPDILPDEEHDFILRSSGKVTSFTNQDDIIGAKKGGPLDKLMDKSLSIPNGNSMPSKIEFGKLDISGKIEITSPDGSSKNMDMESIKPQLIKTIISHLNGTFRNGGVPSSKETTDVM